MTDKTTETKPKRVRKASADAVSTPAKPAKAAAAEAVKVTASKPSAGAGKKTTRATAANKTGYDTDLRQKMVVETAYYISQHRHNPKGEMDDWLFAESLVDGLINSLH